ncbi:PREDICTED: uncharacterized protein LOC104783517 [Camelina sativa]|uniref:Uncharacterized protein LOC104783517 n=1 Tax=Camelina sativa TaxID=90675 RepID=A0ABM0YWN0_CAMSA|nr:PREDICTED: uncharacterized protein LOC104783517 [Camelina sativa]
MAVSFAFLRDLHPYKTNWRVQVKILQSWHQYTPKAGETLECILADSTDTNIHASVKKDLVIRHENQLLEGQWRFIETFSLTNAAGYFRPTGHVYKINFLNGTNVRASDNVCESIFLSLSKFPKILAHEVNTSILVDVIGQVVNVGDVEDLDVDNKPIKEFKDIICVANSFDVTQLRLNPEVAEIQTFVESIPKDGLMLTFRGSKPKRSANFPRGPENLLAFEQKTIRELKDSFEVGKAKILCTIYGVDTDWSWYKLHVKVMDNTGETKLMLFDTTAADVVSESAYTVLNGSYDEVLIESHYPLRRLPKAEDP